MIARACSSCSFQAMITLNLFGTNFQHMILSLFNSIDSFQLVYNKDIHFT